MSTDVSIDLEVNIERLESFEEYTGVNLQALFASISSTNCIYISGEVHLVDGMKLKQNIQLIISAIDHLGSILGVNRINIRANSFFGFETFTGSIYECPGQVAKVRVHPKNLA